MVAPMSSVDARTRRPSSGLAIEFITPRGFAREHYRLRSASKTSPPSIACLRVPEHPAGHYRLRASGSEASPGETCRRSRGLGNKQQEPGTNVRAQRIDVQLMNRLDRRRRRWGLAFSIALHGGVLYAVWQVPWAAIPVSAVQPRTAAVSRVVWIREVPPIEAPSEPTLDPALEPGGPQADTIVTLVHPAIPELPVRPDLPPPPRSAPEPRRPRPGSEPTVPAPNAPPADRERVSPPAEPDRAAPEAAPDSSGLNTRALPEVDWEKERRDAIESVLEERGQGREPLTFSRDDVIEELEPVEPALPPLVVDNCVIVKSKLQRFAALMTGRCVREARGDLFALIKPEYLKGRPVCVETRPESPGSFLADGTPISTVKCELVADEKAQ